MSVEFGALSLSSDYSRISFTSNNGPHEEGDGARSHKAPIVVHHALVGSLFLRSRWLPRLLPPRLPDDDDFRLLRLLLLLFRARLLRAAPSWCCPSMLLSSLLSLSSSFSSSSSYKEMQGKPPVEDARDGILLDSAVAGEVGLMGDIAIAAAADVVVVVVTSGGRCPSSTRLEPSWDELRRGR